MNLVFVVALVLVSHCWEQKVCNGRSLPLVRLMWPTVIGYMLQGVMVAAANIAANAEACPGPRTR